MKGNSIRSAFIGTYFGYTVSEIAGEYREDVTLCNSLF
jgi:hypothetical protein